MSRDMQPLKIELGAILLAVLASTVVAYLFGPQITAMEFAVAMCWGIPPFLCSASMMLYDVGPEDRWKEVFWTASARLAVITLILCIPLAVVGLSTPVAAQNATNTTTTNATPVYYGGENATVANETWLAGREDGSLDDQVSLLTRLASVIVGSGDPVQGGNAPAGLLVFGLVLMGGAVGSVSRSTAGSVGSVAILTAVAAGIVELGFAPSWAWALILFGIGIILTAAFLRAVR